MTQQSKRPLAKVGNELQVPTGMLFDDDVVKPSLKNSSQPSKEVNAKEIVKRYQTKFSWFNIILFAYFYASSLYGLYLTFTSAKLATTLFAVVLGYSTMFGISAGAHRLWSHRSYKAKWPLRVLLMMLQTAAFQKSIYGWSRDHRAHHKFTETDADPHNANRGFFFSHVGWLLVSKHPDVKLKGRSINVTDLDEDPIVMFQKRNYIILLVVLGMFLPTAIPIYFWGETFTNAWFVATMLRHVWTLNTTFLVNSVAHMWGNKPYEKNIHATDNNKMSIAMVGESWHNYHHVFPWDYMSSELGKYSTNITTLFIDFFAKIGWAYDLKTVSEDVIRKRVRRTGDGTHEVWGWGDKDMSQDLANGTIIQNRSCNKQSR